MGGRLQEKIDAAACSEESTGDCPGPRNETTDGLHVTQGTWQRGKVARMKAPMRKRMHSLGMNTFWRVSAVLRSTLNKNKGTCMCTPFLSLSFGYDARGVRYRQPGAVGGVHCALIRGVGVPRSRQRPPLGRLT